MRRTILLFTLAVGLCFNAMVWGEGEGLMEPWSLDDVIAVLKTCKDFHPYPTYTDRNE